MAWSDVFIPSGNQTADEQQANLDRQKALYEQRLQKRQDEGTITSQDLASRELYVSGVQLDDQNAAATEGFVEGAHDGFINVLNFPGQVTGAVGDSAGKLLGGILKNIPWWAYLAAAGALFVWMGGLTLLKGRLSR
jgi:hypothetical protein